MAAATFYNNQMAAATNILAAFSTGTQNYALLIAEMQSGKTGAFQALIRQALETHLVDRVYILCGSAETVLRKQAHDETEKYNPVPKAADQIVIYFRTDFAKPTTTMNTHRALIVIDESHLDSFNGSEMMVFLARHGLTLQGTSPAMTANQTYICSVSATPYAELAKIRDGTALPKHVEHLQPGPGYYGLRHYEADGLLRETYDIAANSDAFRALLTSVTAPKWILMRAVNTETIETVRAICSIENMPPIMEYTSARKDVTLTRKEAESLGMPPTTSTLESPPAVPTIVHIKGTCRVGKVVPKQHIAFVWEDSKSPRTDTLVQALPGRMCGYADAFGPEKPTIYVSKALLEGRKSVLTLTEGDDDFSVSELDRHGALTDGVPVVPAKGMNLTRCRMFKREEDALTQTPPFLLDMSDQTNWTEASMYARLSADLTILSTSPTWALLTPEQQAEITTYLSRRVGFHTVSPRTIHTRRLTPSNDDLGAQKAYFVDLINAHSRRTTAPESSYGWDLTALTSLTFHVVEELKPGLPSDVRRGYVYCVFYTVANPRLEAIHLRTRIPETDTDTVFDDFELTEDLIRKAATLAISRRECDYDDDVASLPSPFSSASSFQGGGGSLLTADAASGGRTSQLAGRATGHGGGASVGGGSVSSDPVSVTTASAPKPAEPKPTVTATASASAPKPATEPISYWGVPLTPDMSENPALLRAFLSANSQGTSGTRPITPAFRLSKTAYHFTVSQKKGHDLCDIVREIGETRGLRVTFECGIGSDYTNNFYIKSVTWTPK